jgi:hypothetical protein
MVEPRGIDNPVVLRHERFFAREPIRGSESSQGRAKVPTGLGAFERILRERSIHGPSS